MTTPERIDPLHNGGRTVCHYCGGTLRLPADDAGDGERVILSCSICGQAYDAPRLLRASPTGPATRPANWPKAGGSCAATT